METYGAKRELGEVMRTLTRPKGQGRRVSCRQEKTYGIVDTR